MNSILTDISRRAFVERFAKAVFGVSLLPAISATARGGDKVGGKAKSVIFLYMRGGISHIDTFDPKPGKPEMARRAGDPDQRGWRADFRVVSAAWRSRCTTSRSCAR